jgi:microsomal dipeptidase-like Zn-dependent dipeptidase
MARLFPPRLSPTIAEMTRLWARASLATALLSAACSTAQDAPRPPLFGFADLHAHPASFLAFGATLTSSGLFWGRPGLALSDAAMSLESDLPACDPATHAAGDGPDFVRDLTRAFLVSSSETSHAFAHGKGGAPGFAAWPHSQSRLHQQMHITWLKRAYDGGLRLLVATAVDNELLSRLFRRVSADGFPIPERDFDYRSAQVQLAFLTSMAAANSDWMTIAKSSTEARRAIESGKLALVLGLEFDRLTLEQVASLRREFGVAHVTPIHLVDNDFGGAAVYDDLFNASSEYLGGAYFRVTTDPHVAFRLRPPKRLALTAGIAVLPQSVQKEEYCTLGYGRCDVASAPADEHADEGHRNARGADRAAISALMDLGLLVDVAHMGESATEDTLAVAESRCYPILNTHTGLRTSGAPSESERDLLSSHAARMAALGGVVGLGVTGNVSPTLVLSDGPMRLSLDAAGASMTRDPARGPAAGLTGSPIRSMAVSWTYGKNVPSQPTDVLSLRVRMRGGRVLHFPLSLFEPAKEGDSKSVSLTMPGGADYPASELERVELVASLASGLSPTYADLDAFSIRLVTDEGTSALMGPVSLSVSSSDGDRVMVRGPSAFAADDARTRRLRVAARVGAVPVGAGEAFHIRVLSSDEAISGTAATLLGPWSEHTSKWVDLPLRAEVSAASITGVHLSASSSAPLVLSEVSVSALKDPAGEFVPAYDAALELMGGRGVALGTDMNGLSPQMPFTAPISPYTLSAGASRSFAPAGLVPLGAATVGGRRFDIATDGVAHVGLLPDLIEAFARRGMSERSLDALFRSANDLVLMWESVERARAVGCKR